MPQLIKIVVKQLIQYIMFKLIPKKILARITPGILAKIATIVFNYIVKKFPNQYNKVEEYAQKLVDLIQLLLESVKNDGKFDADEIKAIEDKCKELIP